MVSEYSGLHLHRSSFLPPVIYMGDWFSVGSVSRADVLLTGYRRLRTGWRQDREVGETTSQSVTVDRTRYITTLQTRNR